MKASSAVLQKRVIEEPDYAPLVLLRLRGDAADVAGAAHLPDRLRLTGVLVEGAVRGLLDRLAALAVDEEHRARRDLGHEAPQVGRRLVAGEDRRRRGGDGVADDVLPA